MTQIEKQTISLPYAVKVIGFIFGVIITVFGTYQAAMSGVRDGFEGLNNRVTTIEYRLNIEENNRDNENKLIRRDITELQDGYHDLKEAAVSYIGTGLKPEETRIKQHR